MEKTFIKCENQLKTLATEVVSKQNEQDQEIITRMTSQFYAAILNKLDDSKNDLRK